jgi:hypothetical protein
LRLLQMDGRAIRMYGIESNAMLEWRAVEH